MLTLNLENDIENGVNLRRVDCIEKYINNASVLHIGCVGGGPGAVEGEDWTHNHLSKRAASVTGIDINTEGIEAMKAEGYQAQVADVTELEIDSKFEVIFAGEVIEHISNFDGFFRSISNHLKKDGVLIITTPNVMAIHYQLNYLINDSAPNSNHTGWFDEHTLDQLMNRFGFTTSDVHYIALTPFEFHPKKLIPFLVERILPAKIGHRNLIVVAERK